MAREPKTIDQAIKDVERAKARLEKMIYHEIDACARRNKVDKIVFGLATHIERDGKEISLAGIEKLEDVFSDHIHRGGFQAIWKSSEGWC